MFCRVVTVLFTLAYAVALSVYYSNVFGMFGQKPDGLSGIYLIPLGMPWVMLPAPENLLAELGVLSPALNLALIWFLCRWARGRA